MDVKFKHWLKHLLKLEQEKTKFINILFIIIFIYIIVREIYPHLLYNKTSFQVAVSRLLKEEGGIVNDKNDKGGITKYGISLNFLKNLIQKNPSMINEFDLHHNKKIDFYDIEHMNKAEAEYIYKTQWWNKYNYGGINYQPLADKVFDISVNMGPKNAALLLAKACKELNDKKFCFKVTPKLNMQIVEYINALPEESKQEIITNLKKLCLLHYFEIVKKNPSQREFLRGWVRRANN